MFRRIVLFVVHSENDRDVFALGRRGDEHLLRSSLQVTGSLWGVGEPAGRLDHELDSQITPGQFGRLAFGNYDDSPTVDLQSSVLHGDLALVRSVVSVIFE